LLALVALALLAGARDVAQIARAQRTASVV
jgi:hypothetical protein